jgi:hypothetical protein
VTMDPDQALEIVRKLAEGVDPATGQRYPADSPYQQADTVRALYLAIDALERLKRAQERQKSLPAGAGRPWTTEEEQRMLQQFDAKEDVAVIAQELNRTSGAIWSRLEKIGRIPKREIGGSSARRASMPPGPDDSSEATPF